MKYKIALQIMEDEQFRRFTDVKLNYRLAEGQSVGLRLKSPKASVVFCRSNQLEKQLVLPTYKAVFAVIPKDKEQQPNLLRLSTPIDQIRNILITR